MGLCENIVEEGKIVGTRNLGVATESEVKWLSHCGEEKEVGVIEIKGEKRLVTHEGNYLSVLKGKIVEEVQIVDFTTFVMEIEEGYYVVAIGDWLIYPEEDLEVEKYRVTDTNELVLITQGGRKVLVDYERIDQLNRHNGEM